MNYVIVDTKTGAWDGVYFTRELALEAFESLTYKIPNASWVLQEHQTMPRLFEKDFWIEIYDKEIGNV